uniref:Uncharacterized protein n=1 Tax=Ascaris lumbricoides TaxID=6252 RepID=A0A0M3IGZ1_ASCLU
MNIMSRNFPFNLFAFFFEFFRKLSIVEEVFAHVTLWERGRGNKEFIRYYEDAKEGERVRSIGCGINQKGARLTAVGFGKPIHSETKTTGSGRVCGTKEPIRGSV